VESRWDARQKLQAGFDIIAVAWIFLLWGLLAITDGALVQAIDTREQSRLNATSVLLGCHDCKATASFMKARLDSLLALDSFVPCVCMVVEHQGVVAQNFDILFTPA